MSLLGCNAGLQLRSKFNQTHLNQCFQGCLYCSCRSWRPSLYCASVNKHSFNKLHVVSFYLGISHRKIGTKFIACQHTFQLGTTWSWWRTTPNGSKKLCASLPPIHSFSHHPWEFHLEYQSDGQIYNYNENRYNIGFAGVTKQQQYWRSHVKRNKQLVHET